MLSLVSAVIALLQGDLPADVVTEVRTAAFGVEADIGYSPADYVKYRSADQLPSYEEWTRDALRFEASARGLGQELASAESATELLASAWRAGGFELAEVAGEERAELPSLSLPTDVARPIERFLGELQLARGFWDRAIAEIPASETPLSERALHYFDGGANEETRALFEDFDRAAAGRSALTLLAASEELASALGGVEFAGAPGDVLRVETEQGLVLLAGPGAHKHRAEPCALLIDFGGDDRYAAGVGCGRGEDPLCVVIDLGGDDVYPSGRSLAQAGVGAGVAGIGILIDAAGSDRYEVSSYGAGFAALGAGILHDWSGDDRYVGESNAQAVGFCGVGLLLDDAGDDHYELFTFGQGMGWPLGCGLLCDRLGDDRYIARDDELRTPSPQAVDHNVSLVQGCGYAWRDDTGGSSASGGLGILLDGAGDDHYRGAVFAQAIGYWFGVGMLFDSSGADDYEAQYYGQSAAAHFGLAYLRDSGGDDRYSTKLSQSLGNGRDLSIAVFRDDAGDDYYFAPDRSLGCGDLAGTGVFLDLHGADSYRFETEVNCGLANLPAYAASGPRLALPTVGVFLELGDGEDSYEPARIEAGARWARNGPYSGMRSIGVVAE